MAARAKKHIFLAVFRKRGKNDGFLALAAIFLRFRQNKKNWNSNLDHLEHLLLNRFCSQMKLIFSLFIVNAVLHFSILQFKTTSNQKSFFWIVLKTNFYNRKRICKLILVIWFPKLCPNRYCVHYNHVILKDFLYLHIYLQQDGTKLRNALFIAWFSYSSKGSNFP